MTVFLCLLIIICIIGAKIAPEKEFFKDYASVDKSNALKGIFVVLVFFSHAKSYLVLESNYDQTYLLVQEYLRQLIVVPFLFFSGYGIMYSIKRKGSAYIKTLPVHRILKILLHFDIVIILFVIVNLIVGNEMSIKSVLLSFLTWDSIGNSNWYILAILLAYIMTFIAFSISKKNHILSMVITTVLVIAVIIVVSEYRPGYYYNTLLCYILGMWYNIFKEKIDAICMKNQLTYIVIVGICAAIYYVVHKHISESVWWYEMWAIMFMLLVLLFTMKVSINNGLLQFLGKHIFSIYILQRIPMILLSSRYNCSEVPYVFIITAFIITLIMAIIFDKAMDKLDGIVFKG